MNYIPDTLTGIMTGLSSDANSMLPYVVGVVIALAMIPFVRKFVRSVFR